MSKDLNAVRIAADPRGRRAQPIPVLQAPGFALRAAEQRRSALWRDLVGASTTTAGCALLCSVALWPGEDQQFLGEQVGIDKATVTELVKQQVNSSFAVRRVASDDARRRRLWLTPDGEAALLGFTEVAKAVDEQLLAPLSAADRLLVRSLWRRVGRVSLQMAELGSAPGARTSAGRGAGHFLMQAGFFLRRVRQEHARTWDALVPSLTPGQYATLDVLYYKPGHDVRSTARDACLEETTGARLLSRLQRKHLIVKSTDADDKRRRRLDLTELGRRELREATPGVNRVQDILMAPLSSYERELFNRLTSRAALLA